MKAFDSFYLKEWKTRLILLLVSFLIYFIYFHHIFFNLNSILSSLTSDTIKNYFTFFYHINFDKSVLHFNGMAYPYGEHIVYTDCQPLLTFILRPLQFTHSYSIGILHALIYLSFIITPLILFNIFRIFEVNQFVSFFVALAIGLLSPQFLKINAGHHGLAYAAMIPYSIYLLTSFHKFRTVKILFYVFIYHCLLFLIHPYMGFSICLFSLLYFLMLFRHELKQKTRFRIFVFQIVSCLSPILLFKLFMYLTDSHPNRTNEPYGLNMMIENIDSILSPVFGPMKSLMEIFFNQRILHFEGHTYLGFFTIILSLGFILIIVFMFSKIKIKKELLSLLFAAFVLLLISFGFHNQLVKWLGLDLAFMNQFRATCRFAWFFYYVLPIFLVITLYQNILKSSLFQKNKLVFAFLPFLFFASNLWEANYMFKMDENVFWKFKNIFNSDLLNSEEVNNLKIIKANKIQAIVPLPLFHSGSEMYDRTGFNSSMLPSMLYSGQTGIPILSVLMSRTSMDETKETINLLNSYKTNRPAVKLLNSDKFLIIKTENSILPDETRLFGDVKLFSQNDSLQFGLVSKNDFIKRKLDSRIIILENKNKLLLDSNNVVFIHKNENKVFKEANMKDFTTIYTLDSNKIKSGRYIVSLKFYYTLNNYHALACDMIVTESFNNNFIWKYMLPMRFLSGFYNGFAVMESFVDLDKNKKYEFVIAGREDRIYKISDFMLRPMDCSVLIKTANADTTFNNFPK